MITVPEAVRQLVRQTPYIEEGIAQGVVNLSAFARTLQPEIEKKLFKTVEIGAIVMALKRLAQTHKQNQKQVQIILQSLQDITIRSNLMEVTFAQSDTLVENQLKLMQEVSKQPQAFLTITKGVFETTIITSAFLTPEVEKIFKKETLRSSLSNLSAITLILPKENVEIPGCYYAILKSLAWEGINVIEVVSNYTELTIIVDRATVDQAFSALKRLSE